MNKIFLSFTLGLILTFPIFTNNSYAEGGNQIWLKKTKRGIDISCPSGFQYDEEIRYMCTKQNDSGFDISLSYNDLYVEKEFFDEKEIMKQAIILVKLASNVKIIEKKTSTWFGKITADIKYESEGLKGLQRMIVFNDGTVIVMHYLSEKKSYDTADKILSENIKILEPNQVKELEKIQAEYTKQAQELASKRDAEKYKQKLEQDKKKKEQEKKDKEEREAKIKKEKEIDKLKKIKEKELAAQKQKERKELAAQKAIEDAKPIGKDKLSVVKGELSGVIIYWNSKVDSLFKRYEKANNDWKFTVKGFDELRSTVKNFERDTLTINENSTRNQINAMINRHELPILTKYNDIEKEIKKWEDHYKAFKSLYPS